MKKKTFSVIEYGSFYAIRHNQSGEERHMGDGVDTLFNQRGEAYSPGTKTFIRRWEKSLNTSESETYDTYFGDIRLVSSGSGNPAYG